MKKFSISILAIVLGLVFFVSIVSAEMSKEGNAEIRGAKSGTMQRLAMGEGRSQINYEETGVIIDAPEDCPFLNATWHAIGTLHGYQGKFEATGGLVFTRPNGDQIFATIGTGGKSGEGISKGGVQFVGGTGECTGIEGEMMTQPRPKTKSSKEGSYQQVVLNKVTWKIP
jgi:hypothetical protein